MKKNYFAPEAEAIEIKVEGAFLQTSPGGTEATGEGGQGTEEL